MSRYWNDISQNTLYHHGILGQKWGVRRFQNKNGTLTQAGKDRLKTKIVNRLAAVDNNSNYVFTYNDKPLCPSPIYFAFKKAIEKSGLKPIRIHDLRHSHTSWLIGNGMNIVAVSKRMPNRH